MTKRSSNVDLFRVIATLLVVLLHVVGFGGIFENTSPYEINHWTARFFEVLSYCAVDCFALISGYLMVNRKIKLRSIINIWFQVVFYAVLLSAGFYFLVPGSISTKHLILSVLPVLGRKWWYVSAYFGLFFFMPFLNKAVENISRQTYNKFLLLILVFVCVMECGMQKDAFLIGSGYSTIWLIIVYLFGAYIRKYNMAEKISAGKSILVYFAMIILTFALEIGLYFSTNLIWGKPTRYDMLISYTSITILMSAIFLFLFCLNVKINSRVSKIIGVFSSASLGVYLIHVYPLIFQNNVSGCCISFANKPLIVMVAGIFLVTLVIFVSCTIIDLLRIQLFRLIKVGKWSEAIENKINSLYLKVFERV